MSESKDRSEEYLWDRSGPPDPQIDELERKLRRYRYAPDRPEGAEALLARSRIGAGRDCLPGASPEASSWWRRVARTPAFRFGAAIAAGIVLLLGGAVALLGTRASGSYEVRGVAGLTRVRPGDSFVVGERPAVVDVGSIGDVTLQPGARVRVVDCGEKVHHLDLEFGTLSASIFARPRLFQVGTPAGLTVDLGCIYDLSVDAQGTAQLFVRTGQVAFETRGRKVLVPRGAQCEAPKGGVPNTPVMRDADPDFARALRAVEFDPAPASETVDTLLEKSRREDSLSLWHLLDATSPELRERCYERLARLYPQPSGVTKEGILDGDPAMREAWRREAIERDWR